MAVTPTPEEAREARLAAGLSQEAAAALVHQSDRGYWSRVERGVIVMDPSRWELFRIKTGTHPEFGPLNDLVS